MVEKILAVARLINEDRSYLEDGLRELLGMNWWSQISVEPDARKLAHIFFEYYVGIKARATLENDPVRRDIAEQIMNVASLLLIVSAGGFEALGEKKRVLS